MSESGSASKRKRQPQFEARDLIRLVKERRCLWDRGVAEYRDKGRKDKAWLEIYRTVEPEYDQLDEKTKNFIGTQITRKWYNLRDSYVKSKKHGVRSKPYVYSTILKFLETIYEEGKDTKSDDSYYDNGSDHLNDDYNDANETEIDTEEAQPWMHDVFLVEGENETKKPKTESDKETNLVYILENMLKSEDDEDRAFFKSITPTVKKLSDDSKMEFRIQVMNLLKNLKNKEKEQNKLRLKKEMVDSD